MSKVRVYELAKDYGMKGPEMADLLRSLGFENVKSHMTVLDPADQLMVMARLEAQGLTPGASGASTEPADEVADEDSGVPKKKLKKSLPPPLAQPKKKSLPTELPASAAAPALQPEPTRKPSLPAAAEGDAGTAPVRAPAPPPAPIPAARRAPDAPAQSSTGPAAKPELSPTERSVERKLDQKPATDVPAARPVGKTPTVSPAHPATPAPTTPARPGPALQSPVAREAAAAPSTERKPTAIPIPTPPAAAATPPIAGEPTADAPIAPAPVSDPSISDDSAGPNPEDTNPEAASPEGAEAEAATPDVAQGPRVKRLLVPQAKATVVGRIELPQETIRDATRRSAPAADKGVAGARLRRMALQNTQRSAVGRSRGKGFAPPPRYQRGGGRRAAISVPIDPNKVVEIQPPVSMKVLSEALGIKVNDLLTTLQFKIGIKGKTINSFLTAEDVELVAEAVNRKINVVEVKAAEDELLQALDTEAADAETFERAPIVTFMGHVDHGKTSLLDALRASDIAKNEAGGITQHIGAYRIKHGSGAEFVVLDTPGHAAFSAMRARGAKVTDVVVLVVAADDGVMPQTEEAIAHAKDADVPIVVAINKCDKPGANPMQVMQQLAVKGLQPEEWGGTTQMAQVSALTGAGIDALVEKIVLEAHIKSLSARPSAPGAGVVIESKQSPREGVVINVVVMDGTVNVRDHILCGNSFARVRGMIDDHGRPVKSAGPATPVSLLGVDSLPEPGEKFYVVTDQKKAREVAEDRERRARAMSLAQRSSTAVTIDNLTQHLAAQKVSEIKVIVKADVTGSLEPIRKCLADLATDEVRVNVIHSGLGGITDSDVSLAEAGGAMVIGFNTAPEATARQHAERAGVTIRLYDVIYQLIDDVKMAMEGTLTPDEVEKTQGFAEVRAVFKSSRFGTIAGCYVKEGSALRSSKARLSRDGQLIYTGQVSSLRREKDDTREVKAGFECGLTLRDWQDIAEGDVIEFYDVSLVKRTLD